MKFGQLIKYSERYTFFKDHAKNEVERLVPDLFLFFKKALFKIKVSVQNPIFNKNTLYNISDC